MTCQGCVATVQRTLASVEGVTSVDVDLTTAIAEVEHTNALSLQALQEIMENQTHFRVTGLANTHTSIEDKALPEKSVATYKPLILIVLFLVGVSYLVQLNDAQFSFDRWMRHFMSGFFLVFSFFKLLNVREFAQSYRMYDIVAKAVPAWGLIYPFVELALGIGYLINFQPEILNAVTVVILGVSAIGVIRANLRKDEIRCACLGTVFNLPMSTVTIVEDVTMVVMALWMLMM
ncbi:MAG: heavy metal translocating P-type ATPase [Flavobacteriales bacterium]|nr:heavy metal translocating P-type ATPase [Bacteroidota bacterium]MCB9241196.1 heavy metal translocating P-type ATPase [Flavobacteriales bacterium]